MLRFDDVVEGDPNPLARDGPARVARPQRLPSFGPFGECEQGCRTHTFFGWNVALRPGATVDCRALAGPAAAR
jgi:hypothetical protein